jgi:hypothetical protein
MMAMQNSRFARDYLLLEHDSGICLLYVFEKLQGFWGIFCSIFIKKTRWRDSAKTILKLWYGGSNQKTVRVRKVVFGYQQRS